MHRSLQDEKMCLIKWWKWGTFIEFAPLTLFNSDDAWQITALCIVKHVFIHDQPNIIIFQSSLITWAVEVEIT